MQAIKSGNSEPATDTAFFRASCGKPDDTQRANRHSGWRRLLKHELVSTCWTRLFLTGGGSLPTSYVTEIICSESDSSLIFTSLESNRTFRPTIFSSPPIHCMLWDWHLAAWHSGRTPVFELSLSHARPVADHILYVGKPSAIGQPTRPNQPFIRSGSINWVVGNIIGCVLVAPSGECSRGYAGAVINRRAPCMAAI